MWALLKRLHVVTQTNSHLHWNLIITIIIVNTSVLVCLFWASFTSYWYVYFVSVSFLHLRYGRHIECIRQTLCRSFHSDTIATFILPKPCVIIVIVFSLFSSAHSFCAFIFRIHELVDVRARFIIIWCHYIVSFISKCVCINWNDFK